MINKKDITLLIAGPIQDRSMQNIECYKNFCQKIIVHTWDDINIKPKSGPNDQGSYEKLLIKYLKLFDNNSDEKVKLYIQSPPKEPCRNAMFRHYKTLMNQIAGILEGAKRCETKYIIRTRSDEFFTDLQPLITKYCKNKKEHIVAGNVVWKKYTCNYIPLKGIHMGDHLFMAETKDVVKTYQQFYYLNRIENAKITVEFQSCEEVLAHLFIRETGKTPIPINVQKLAPYEVSVNGILYNEKSIENPFRVTSGIKNIWTRNNDN